MSTKQPKAPKPPPPPKMPESPIDMTMLGDRPDSMATAYRTLVSSSPIGQRKPALGAKKSLLGGV